MRQMKIIQKHPAKSRDDAPEQCVECEAARRMRAESEAMPQRGLDRREFVAQSALGAIAALLVSACGGGSGGAGGVTGPNPGPGRSNSLTVQLSNFPALANIGGMARVDTGGGTPVAAVRTGASTFAAFSLICPHFGCTVGVGTSSFQCPCHGARFAADGHWTGGQPTGNLTPLNASYASDTDTLTITA